MSNQVTGRVFVKVNGKLLRSKEGAKLVGYAGRERTAIVGNEVHGYAEKVVAPSIECVISDKRDTSLEELAAVSDATVTFETDTGKTYILRNAWVSNAIDLTGGEGEVELVFMGAGCEEVL